jgi:predicted transcriptional regulator
VALKNKHLLWPAAAVFKNLRTSTKLFILCGMFVGSIMLATYSLIDEKQIAISFVRKELVGAQYLEALRRESFLHKKWRHPCCHLRRT